MTDSGNITTCTGIQHHQNIDKCSLCLTENNLVKQLKQICDENGKEIDPNASSKLFHQLGQVYYKRIQVSSNRDWGETAFDLIRSIALHIAAIIRSPNDTNIVKKDLQNLCKRVLKMASATDQNADLVEMAETIKLKLNNLRREVNHRLYQIPKIENNLETELKKQKEENKINNIKLLQDKISKEYTHVMSHLANCCMNVMGIAPCKFALAGMGSLARKEVTPFSDFENIILLEEMSHGEECSEITLNYFRWFSVIFHTILINLGETIIPSVAIYSLNNEDSPHGNWYFDKITPRGVSLDGMMPYACKFPIGRQERTKNKSWKTELIKPVSKMLQYLKSEENFKNGYHLSDILTKVCFVFGDKTTFNIFQEGMQTFLDKEEEKIRLKQVTAQINDDISKFSARFILSKSKSVRSINVKKDVYRCTTLFISALGRIYNVHASSCFDIITELKKHQFISDYAEHKLMYAVAIACEMRLKWYMKCKAQIDVIHNEVDEQGAPKILIQTVGKSSIYSYYKIAYALQCDISKKLNLKRKYFFSNPLLLVIKLDELFGYTRELSTKIYDNKNEFNQREQFLCFDECLKQLELHDFVISKNVFENVKTDELEKNENIKSLLTSYKLLGDKLYKINLYDDAIEAYQNAAEKQKELDTKRKNPQSNNPRIEIATCNNNKRNEHRPKKEQNDNLSKPNHPIKIASRQLQKNHTGISENVKQTQKQNSKEDKNNHSSIQHQIGKCFLEIGDFEKALTYLKASLKLQEGKSTNNYSKREYAKTLQVLGECHFHLNSLNKAKELFKKSLQIVEKISENINIDREYSIALHKLARCLFEMNYHNEAMCHLVKSLQIIEHVQSYSDNENNHEHSSILHTLGQCCLDMKDLNEAMNYLKQSLKIKKRISPDVDTDRNYSVTLHEIGRCLLNMNNPNKAMSYLKQSLQIKERTSPDVDTDGGYSVTLHEIGRCFMDMNNPNKAMSYLKQSLQIKERTSPNVDNDRGYAISLHTSGRCFMDMNRFKEAINYLKQSLKIRERTSPDVDTDREYSVTLHTIGQCYMNMNDPNEAMYYLKQSLQIQERTSADVDTDRDYSIILHDIGQCLLNMNKPSEAMSFLKQLLQIKERTLPDVNTDREYSITLHAIGQCLMEMNRPNEAMSYLKKSLQIKERTSPDIDNDRSFSVTLHAIGQCFLDMENPNEAMSFLKQSLQIKERISRNIDTDRRCSITLDAIGRCFMVMNNFTDALNCLKKSLQIKERTSPDIVTDRGYAITLHASGQCYMGMNNLNEAVKFINLSLQIQRRTSPDVDTDRSYSITLHDLGQCLLNMNNPKEAINYLNQSLQIQKRLIPNVAMFQEYFVTMNAIRQCFTDMNKL